MPARRFPVGFGKGAHCSWGWSVRKVILVAVLSVLSSFSIFAEDASKVDLFGGYSFFREGNNNIDGWTGSAAYKITSWLGVEGEASGRYQSQDVTVLGRGFELDRTRHWLLVGPRYTFWKNERLAPFGHTLFGALRARSEGISVAGGVPSVLTAKDDGFAMALGGGLDVTLNDHFAIRAVQADYLRSDIFGGTTNAMRLSFGLVFRF
jgi:Outer membrane protein beta-barrel domain